MIHDLSILKVSQGKVNAMYKYWFKIIFTFPECWIKRFQLLITDWKAITISFTIGLRRFYILLSTFNQCTLILNKINNKELIEKIKVEIRKVDNWRIKGTKKSQTRSLIFNYLYDEQTGLPVEAYTPYDGNTLTEDCSSMFSSSILMQWRICMGKSIKSLVTITLPRSITIM